MSELSLFDALPLGVSLELIKTHGIAVDIFDPSAITLGSDQGWTVALNRHAAAQQQAIAEESGRNNDIATEQRSVARKTSLRLKYTPHNNWNIYSVFISSRGSQRISAELEIHGQRLHPSNRTGAEHEVKFDTSGSRVKVFLPALNWAGANQLLGHYGFRCSPAEYRPHLAWEFVFANPQVPVWVEEAALKAMASCSLGQLAVSVNGINASGQKTRSDRLRKPLEMLAQRGRRMVVRFDHGRVSEKQAQMVCGQLERAGAQASWYAWWGAGPQKTDDYVAAKLRGLKAPAHFPLIAHQEDVSVVGRRALPPYSRLTGKWTTISLDREFQGSDIVEALRISRIVALHGPTGTRKSIGTVEAIDQIEIETGRSHVVLGIYHRASLVHKGAYEFGVRDMSAPRGSVERERGLHEGVVCRDGLFCCCESIKKQRGNEWDLCRWSYELLENPRPTILFLDEISQTMLTLLLGGTDSLGQIRAEAVRTVERLLKNPCVKVIVAESGLGDIELQWLQDLTGSRPCVVSTSFTRERTLFVGPSSSENIDSLQQLGIHALNQGHRFWCSMGTASSLKTYIGPLVEQYGGALVTGETSSDKTAADIMGNAQEVAASFPVFGYSPAITSGISTTFAVGLAGCVQQYAMSPEDALQALDRARNAAVRVLLYPSSAPLAKIGSNEIFRDNVLRAKSISATRGDEQAYVDFWGRMAPATREYALNIEARNNYEAVFNDHVLKYRLVEQGYTLKPFTELLGQSPVMVPLKQKVKAEKEQAMSLKQELLNKLCLNQITLEDAQEEALQAATGGLAVDYEKVDPSQAWGWLQALGVPALVAAGSYHAGTEEFNFTADAVRQLDKNAARELKRVLGGRTVIPGPEDEVKASFINSLLKAADFSSVESGQLRIKGERVRVYRLR